MAHDHQRRGRDGGRRRVHGGHRPADVDVTATAYRPGAILAGMTIPVEDRMAIHDLLALHGHLSDAGAFDRMDEVFSHDVVYDMESFGFGSVRGLASLREMASRMGDQTPVGHHVTNIVITFDDANSAHVLSKGIGIRADGTVGSVVYADVVRRLPDGWRIVSRRISARRTPLMP
jgi:hypothetical protein